MGFLDATIPGSLAECRYVERREDSCSWSVQKRASRHFDGETSHGARATADKSSNRCVVNETSDEQAAKDDLIAG